MNFNELLNRIIYLLPQHPEPPNWQIYIAYFRTCGTCGCIIYSCRWIFSLGCQVQSILCAPFGSRPVDFELCSSVTIMWCDCPLSLSSWRDFKMSINVICFVAIIWCLWILVCVRLMALRESEVLSWWLRACQVCVCVCWCVCVSVRDRAGCGREKLNMWAEDWSRSNVWDSNALQRSQTSIHSHGALHGRATTCSCCWCVRQNLFAATVYVDAYCNPVAVSINRP